MISNISWYEGHIRITIYKDGRIEHTINNKYHNENGPAVIDPNGSFRYYNKGKLHRVGAPAVLKENGDSRWYFKGRPHREDGPAVECSSGIRVWYRNGRLHRENGPAFEGFGTEIYYLNNKKLRVTTLKGLKKRLKLYYIEQILSA